MCKTANNEDMKFSVEYIKLIACLVSNRVARGAVGGSGSGSGAVRGVCEGSESLPGSVCSLLSTTSDLNGISPEGRNSKSCT